MSPTVQEVKRAHEAELLALPGVVSVGVGRDDEGLPALVVGLAEPRPDTAARLPATLEGYRVLIQTVGTIEAL